MASSSEAAASCSGSEGLRSRSTNEVPVDKLTCGALKSYLKARCLSYSGLRKAELVAK